MGPLLSQDLKSSGMTIWNGWLFDGLMFMATYLGAVQVAAQTIIRSIALLTFMMAAGYAFASKIFIGLSVGAGKHQAAKMYYCVSLTAGVTAISIIVVLEYFFRDWVIEQYTHQDDIVSTIVSVWPIFMVYQLLTIFDDNGSAVIKGTGKQGLGLILNTFSTLLIAVPVALYATFKLDWGLQGIWFGPVCQ